MAPPTLTPEQRSAALAAAQKARKDRAEALAELTAGTLTFEGALGDKRLQRAKVLTVLKALPGIGDAKAAAILKDARVPEARRVGGIGSRQRAALLSQATA